MKIETFSADKFKSNQETPVVLEDGRRVFILSINARGRWCIVGQINGNDLFRWDESGKPQNQGICLQLYFVPKRKTIPIAIFSTQNDSIFKAITFPTQGEIVELTQTQSYRLLKTIDVEVDL